MDKIVAKNDTLSLVKREYRRSEFVSQFSHYLVDIQTGKTIIEVDPSEISQLQRYLEGKL